MHGPRKTESGVGVGESWSIQVVIKAPTQMWSLGRWCGEEKKTKNREL